MIPDLDARLALNLDVVMAEIDAPPRGRFERLLLRARVPEPTARLVAATPTLRLAWFVSVAVVLLFAASAGDATWDDTGRLAVLLTLAPLVPVVGVALAYGTGVDRAHEVSVAAPLSGLRLVLLRTATVLGASAALTLLGVLVAPSAGWLRLAWLLPTAATTATTLAVGSRLGMRTAAGIVGTGWIVLVVAVAQAAGDAAAAFRAPGQLVSLAVAVLAAVALVTGRRHLEHWDGR
jgi:hypothetical protein